METVTDTIKSWLRENHTLIGFLMLQAIAIVAYAVRLETRVSIMETRGAEFSVRRMDDMSQRITVLEQGVGTVIARLERILDLVMEDRKKEQPK